jgi:hypothetical protein
MTREELLEKRAEVKSEIWIVEKQLKNRALVAAVDFASMELCGF